MNELTLKEAYGALLGGDTVKDRCGWLYRLTDAGFEIEHPVDDPGWLGRPNLSGPLPEDAPFTLCKPEPKSLSFDEALEVIFEQGGAVIIQFPECINNVADSRNVKYDKTYPWGWFLNDLDLAERRGWSITESKIKEERK